MLRKISLLLCNLLLMRSVHARKANKRSRSANIDILYNYEENEELSTRAKTWNYLRAIELVSKYWCLINADIVNSFESFSSYYLIVTHILISVAETSALKHFPKYSPQPQYRKGKLLGPTDEICACWWESVCAFIWQEGTHTQRKKMAERQTENKVEAAGNNLPALTDYNDGKMF